MPAPKFSDVPRLLAAFEASVRRRADDGDDGALAAARAALAAATASGEPAKIESALRCLKLAREMRAGATPQDGAARGVTVIEAKVDDPDEGRDDD